jgi:hypothetical protein
MSSTSSSKQVLFSEVIITEYPMRLGDNPSCSNGAPVTIGWEPQGTQTRNLEMYEYTRRPRRTRKQLHMSVHRRGHLLINAGHSLEEIGNATMQVQLDRKHRADSLSSHGNWDRVKELLETTGKLPKGILGGVGTITGETLKLGGGFLAKITKPVRKTVQARSA